MIRYGSHYFPDSIEDAIEYAQFLEERGFSKLWIGDSQQLYADPYTSLAGCAAATENLELSPGVTNPVSRHPSVIANSISIINRRADGRADLGIGIGDSGVYSIGKNPATLDEFRDAVTKIQALLAGETVEFNGELFTLEPRYGSIDVYVAAEGPKTLQMAGEVADSVIFGGGTKPEFVEQFGLENLQKGAGRADRTLDDIDLVALTPACYAETRAEAIRELRHLLEPLAYHNFMFSVEEAPEELHDELRRLVEAHEMSEHAQPDAEKPEQISDEVLEYVGDRFAVAGPSSHCQDRLAALDDAGIDEFYLVFPTAVENTMDYAREFEEEILLPLNE
jgi:5,10-methylenetetrahydromethanopterin reductase